MLATEIKNKYRRLLKRGGPDGEVRQQMQSAGFTKEEIEEVFAPDNQDMRAWFVFCTLLSLVAGIILFEKEPEALSPVCFLLSAFCLYKYIRLSGSNKKGND